MKKNLINQLAKAYAVRLFWIGDQRQWAQRY